MPTHAFRRSEDIARNDPSAIEEVHAFHTSGAASSEGESVISERYRLSDRAIDIFREGQTEALRIIEEGFAMLSRNPLGSGSRSIQGVVRKQNRRV